MRVFVGFLLCTLVVVLGAVAILHFWQQILQAIGILIVIGIFLAHACKPAAPPSPEELWHRNNVLNYHIRQDTMANAEAHREAMTEWRQQQQPPPRDPSTWGGGNGGRFC